MVCEQGGFDAAIGGARRDEEKSRAKERIFSFRDEKGQWDPKNQRPELWNLFNARIHPGESLRIFPLSNWTEMDVWQYIHAENIPIVPMYFAKEREMLVRGESLIPTRAAVHSHAAGRKAANGALPHAVAGMQPVHRSHPVATPTRFPKIIEELVSFRRSERENRVIDHDQEGSMEIKKREGYF